MSPPFLRRAASALWTDERHTRIRLQSWSLTVAVYVACGAAMSVFTRWGVLSGPAILAWLGIVLAGLGIFHALIRSQWSAKLADPALSQAQIVFGIFAVMGGYAICGAARSAVLLPLMLILTFGAFSVPWRRMAALTAVALGVMASTIAAMHALRPGRYAVVVDLSNLAVGAIALPAVSAVAMLLGSLRARLHRQRAELQAALARIQDLATLDDLTGLVNRRRAHELLAAEVTRGRRAAQPFAVALVDLDRFKRVNDRFGHAGGDEVLRHFADAARAGMRACDVVARWGGEEFLVLMPETDLASALEALERLRARVAAASIASAQGEMRFTFSAGVAAYRCGQTVADTVARADRALYRAKAAGRNRVEVEDDAVDALTIPRSNTPPAAPPAMPGAASDRRPAPDGSPAEDNAPEAAR